MNRFKKWLVPVALVCLLLATLVGCSNAPASLGEIFDPSGNPFANRFTDVSDLRTATYVVAASDSVHKFEADYFCDGTNDHVQIQAALDALPATGGKVFLLDGTYTVEVSITLDSYQTLRGCGQNTILTTTTTALGGIITATGGSGTEKAGILIADLKVDGGVGGAVNNGEGILWTYVDHSMISNVWSNDHTKYGIALINSDFNRIVGNRVSLCTWDNIYLEDSCHNTIADNVVQDGESEGIDLNYWGATSSFNTIVGNIITGNWGGMSLSFADDNTISDNIITGSGNVGIYISQSNRNVFDGNVIETNDGIGIGSFGVIETLISNNLIRLNGEHGIGLYWAEHVSIVGNVVMENSQTTDNTYDNIQVDEGTDCLIADNFVRMGDEANQPRYGIALIDNDCDRNKIIDNDLYDSGLIAKVYIDPAIEAAGNSTFGRSFVVPFVDGTDPQDSGFLIDADTEFARAFLFLPDEVQQVRFLKIYGRAVAASATTMALEINVNGGADNEAYTTHATAAPNTPSTSSNFAANDVIYWTLTSANILALSAGDSVEVKVLHEAANAGGIETNAYIRVVEIGYF